MTWLLIIILQAPGGGDVTAIPVGRLFTQEGCELAGASMSAALEVKTKVRASWSCTAEVPA